MSEKYEDNMITPERVLVFAIAVTGAILLCFMFMAVYAGYRDLTTCTSVYYPASYSRPVSCPHNKTLTFREDGSIACICPMEKK